MNGEKKDPRDAITTMKSFCLRVKALYMGSEEIDVVRYISMSWLCANSFDIPSSHLFSPFRLHLVSLQDHLERPSLLVLVTLCSQHLLAPHLV